MQTLGSLLEGKTHNQVIHYYSFLFSIRPEKTIFNARLKPYFKSEKSFISLLYSIVCGFVFNSTERTNGSFTSPNYPGLRTDSIDYFDVWLKWTIIELSFFVSFFQGFIRATQNAIIFSSGMHQKEFTLLSLTLMLKEWRRELILQLLLSFFHFILSISKLLLKMRFSFIASKLWAFL